MPMLKNQRHELFAQGLAQGKTADDAYQSAGYRPDRSHAARMATNSHIVARVGELQSRVVEGIVLTKQWVIERLIANANRAMQAQAVLDGDGRPTGEYRYEGSVANRALELLGKEQGMFIDRKEIGRPGEFELMNADELRTYIQREAAEIGVSLSPPPRSNGAGKPH